MVKKHFFILILSFAAIFAQAQEVNWGPELKQSTKNRIESIVGEDANGIYIYRMKSQLLGNVVPVVEHYNKKMVLKYASPLKELSNRNITVNNFWHFNNRLFIYFTEFNGRKRRQTLYYQEVNKKNGKLIGKRKALVEGRSFNRNIVGQLEYNASADSSTAVVLYSPYIDIGIFQKVPQAKFQIQVVDENFKTLWDTNVKAPYDYDLFDVVRVEVDKQGNAYVLAKVFTKNRRNRRNGRVNYTYKVLTIEKEGEEIKEIDLKLDDKFITDITFKVNRKKQLTCAGYYSDRRSSSMKGSFFFTIDAASKEVITKGYKPFSKKFLAKLTSQRRARKGKELYQYYLDEIILRSDGGAVLIGEQYYVVTNTYYTGTGLNRTANTTYTYHYEDIIIININPDASIAWTANIPKHQSASNRAFSSYAHATIRGKIYFVYNERISRRAPVMYASVDTRGNVNIKELFRNRDEGIITRPLLCRQTSKNEMVLYGERGKKYKFGKVKFD